GWRVIEFLVVVADLDRDDACLDWFRCHQDRRPTLWQPGGPTNGRWWRRRPEGGQLSLQGKGPHRVTVCTALQSVATSSDGDVLLAVHLVDNGRCVSPKAGLEPPQLLTRLRIQREEVAIRLAPKDEPTGRDTRPSPEAVRRLVLPNDFVRRA